ncbi:sugar phosphate isomerase/epimerase family protein [Streptomyces sp. NPDC002523]
MDAPAPNSLVLDPDEMDQNPTTGMDLALALGITELEMRTAWGANMLLLEDAQLVKIRTEAEARGMTIAALASPLWKWCRPEASPGRVDSFGFPTQVAAADRVRWIQRALRTAELLGTRRVRIFSHLQVEPGLTEDFARDPLVAYALEHASAAGLRLLLENEPVCTIVEPAALLDVLTAHDGLGLWLDLANLHDVGAATADTITILAPHVEYVHVKDFRFRPDRSRAFCPAGEGEVPIRELVGALARVRPGLPYALETHVRDTPTDALCKGAEFLRGLGLGL